MIYLLCVSHNEQCKESEDDEIANQFKEKITKIYTTHDIDCIIEEYNDDAAEENNCIEVVAESFAEDMNLTHEFCDPNRDERESLGISDYHSVKFESFLNNDTDEEFIEKIKMQFVIRERRWLEILNSVFADHSNILMLIGADHFESFSNLLSDNNYEYAKL